MTESLFKNHPADLRPPKHGCKKHNFTETPSEYFQWHAWAERRILDGDEQEMCPKCHLWLFPEEMNKEGDTIIKLFVDMLNVMEDILVTLEPVGLHEYEFRKKIQQIKKDTRLLMWK